MKIYTLKRDAFALGGGEKGEYGYSYQAYVEESDLPIKFSSFKENFLEAKKIVAENAKVNTFKTGKNAGRDYLWLTGVKLADEEDEDSGQTEAPSAPAKESSSSHGSSAAVPKNDKAYLKDASTVPLDVYRVRANIDGLPGDSATRNTFFKNVRFDAVELLNLIEEVRQGTFEDKTAEMAAQKLSGHELARAKADELKKKDEDIEVLGEEDVPEGLFEED